LHVEIAIFVKAQSVRGSEDAGFLIGRFDTKIGPLLLVRVVSYYGDFLAFFIAKRWV